MPSPFRTDFGRQARRLVAALLAFSTSAFAAPAIVLPFQLHTWDELQHSSARPLAVVFSTTDCSHCPAVIDRLASALRQARSPPRLAVVVVDGRGQEAALLADRHYRQADALYAFDGDGLRLRHRVNPDWRGLTPYVVLLPARGIAQHFNGAPPKGALSALLQP